MKREIKIIAAAILGICLIILLYGMVFSNIDVVRKKKHVSKQLNVNYSTVYSWHMEDITGDMDFFKEFADEYHIQRLYQTFSDQYLAGNDNSFLEELESLNIDTYQLVGDPSWGLDGGHKKIQEAIDKVIAYNKNNLYNIRGLLLDIEPYTNDEIDKFEKKHFDIYLAEIGKVINYAHKNNLKIIVAIPYWYDSVDINGLTKLVKIVDGISVMNYHIDSTIQNIEAEVDLAKLHGTLIDSVYMVKYDDEKYFSSAKEILNDYAKLKQEYKYCKYLYLSLHDYRAIIKYEK